jgi:hypothetical protein
MSNFSDNLSKGIARGYNLFGQARALGSLLGIAQSPRGGSISDSVVSELRKNGIARPTYAYTQITLPQLMRGTLEGAETDIRTLLTYRNDGFSIPGLSLATSEIRQWGYGPTIKRPYGVTYQDVTFNYILDASSNQHIFFYQWMDSIVRHSGKTINGESKYGLQPYEVSFHNDYVSQIDVFYFDETFDRGDSSVEGASKARIVDAYPLFIGDIQYNWAGVDSLIRIPVTFTYRRWEHERADLVTDRATSTNRPTNIFGQLLKVGTALQALSTVRSPRNIADVVNVVNVGRVISQ